MDLETLPKRPPDIVNEEGQVWHTRHWIKLFFAEQNLNRSLNWSPAKSYLEARALAPLPEVPVR